MEYNIDNVAIRWRILTSAKVIWHIFAIALTVSEILTFCNGTIWWQIPDFLSSYLMAIVMFVFFQSLLVKIATWKVWPWKFGLWSWSTIFAMVPFDGKILTFIKVICEHFLTSSHLFWDIHISKLVTLKMQVRVMMYNIHSGAIRWQISQVPNDTVVKSLLVKWRYSNFKAEQLVTDITHFISW